MAIERALNLLHNKEVRHTLIAILFFAVVTFAVFWGYLLGGNAIVGSDGMGPPADLAMMQEDSSYFSSWRAMPALGHLNFPSPTLSALYIVDMEWLGLSPVSTTQVILVSSFWLAGFAMYVCASRILGSSSAGLIAGLAYLFNQVFLSQVTEAHHYFLIGCAIFPLLFLALYRAVNDLDRRSGIVLPVVAYIFGTVAAPNLVMIASIFLILFFLTYILIARGWSWVRRGYSVMVAAVCLILILLPTVLMKYSAGGTPVLATYYPIEQARLYSSYTIYHSFVLASSENTFIYSSDIHQWTFISSLWVVGLIVAIVIPLTALLSILVKEKRHMVISFVVPMAIFIVLATGTNPPFGGLFTYLFKNVPLMDSLRVYSRFHLMTGFAMAMLLAVTFVHIKDIDAWLSRRVKGRKGRALHYIFSDRKRLTVLLAFCLIFPSSAVLTGEIRSFEMPSSYVEPYEWLENQSGDFRVLNLPFQNVFYKNGMAHYDGYPSTMTMDVGMYSPTFSKKPYAFGLETNTYWTFLGGVIGEQQFGYKEMSGLLGGSASVQYVVAQNYASADEVSLFASMDNMTLLQTFEGGGAIYLNGEYQGRVHGLGSLCLASGDRTVIPLIMGSGLVDSSSDGIVLIGQVDNSSTLADLMERSDMIVVPNGDLLEMASEMFPWDNAWTIDLSSYGDKHSEDASSGWIMTNDDVYAGRTSLSTITTTGDRSLDIPTTVQQTGEYDLLVRTIYGPDAGGLNVSLDGNTVISTTPWALSQSAEWIRVQNISLSAGSHQVSISNDGTGRTSIEQVVLVPHDAVESRLSQLTGTLEKYQEKVVYLYSASQAMQWVDGTYLKWKGSEGQGIADSLDLPIKDMVGIDDLVYDQEASGHQAISIDPNGTVLSPGIDDLASGTTYSSTISLRYEGELSGGAIATIVVQGKDDVTGKTVTIGSSTLEGNDTSGGYSSFSFDINVPAGVHQLELNITPAQGVTALYVDRLSLTTPASDHPQAYMDVPVDGTYTIQVKGENASSDSYVSIDGTKYPLTGQNGTLSSPAISITAGSHLVEIGVTDIYSVGFTPSSLVVSHTNSTVSYERKSNIEYEVDVSTDRAGWILLAESYNSMWTAEMDGQELEHVQINGMVNAYYIPSAGNHTITIRFHGQEIYDNMLVDLFAATVGAIALLAVLQLPRVRQVVLRPGQGHRSAIRPFWHWRRKGGS